MRKKLPTKIGLIVIMLLSAALLTACQKKPPTEKTLAETLPDDVKSIIIEYDGTQETSILNIDKVEIEKRQTNEKDDTIYCTIYKSNDAYESVEDWILYYNFYDESGWILDDAEIVEGNVVPTGGVPQHIAEAEMAKYYFDSAEYVTNELTQDETGITSSCIFDASYSGEHMQFDGQAALLYTYQPQYDNYGKWTSALVYIDAPEWNIVGSWLMKQDLILGSSEQLQLEIISFDGNEIEYKATVVFEENTFGAVTVTENTYTGRAAVTYKKISMYADDSVTKYSPEAFVFTSDTGWDRYIYIEADEAFAAGSYGITWRYIPMQKTH